MQDAPDDLPRHAHARRPAHAGESASARPAGAGRHVLSVMRWPLGGIRTYLLYTHPALVAAGWRITFVGPEGKHFEGFAREVASWPGVDCVPAPHRRAALAHATRAQLRARRFTLVNSQGLGAAAQVAVALRTTRAARGTPHVVTSHDVFPPGKHGGIKGWFRKRVLERLLRRADLVINVTDDARDNLLEHLPALVRAGTPMVTIPHGIRPLADDESAPLDPPLRTRLSLSDEPFLLGFLGRFMEQKGFQTLLGALAALREAGTARPFHLVAVGSGDFEREYRKDVEQSGLSACTSFLPFVPDVMPFLRELDLVVMPSLWEAAGLLAMEALVAGTPLLVSDCPGLREVVRDTPARLARTGDAGAWAEALRAIIAEPPVAETRAFMDTARARYDARRTAERTVAVLADVAERTEGRA